MITEFKLGGVTWKVSVDNKGLDKEQSFGTCDYNISEVRIQLNTLGDERSEEEIQRTLYHEITHAILDTMGERELSNNEQFITTFSSFLHQFEKTKK